MCSWKNPNPVPREIDPFRTGGPLKNQAVLLSWIFHLPSDVFRFGKPQIEIGESLHQLIAIAGIRAGFQISCHTRTREEQDSPLSMCFRLRSS